jgi:hypothetical protein
MSSSSSSPILTPHLSFEYLTRHPLGTVSTPETADTEGGNELCQNALY